jgi:amino acid adenylation domain-containing protein
MEKGKGNMAITTSASALSERERQSLVIDFNNSAAAYPSDKTIVELFESQVARTPKDEAVRMGDRSLTYKQLNERANQMAAHLRVRGAGPERFVTLYMNHSIEVLCAILGVLKAGAAYVPVDPGTTSNERLSFKLQDISAGTSPGSALPILVTHPHFASRIPQGAAEVVVLDPDFSQIDQHPVANSEPAASPHNLAYVIYTSGSTGKPKGVLIGHGSLVNYIWWANEKYCQGERLAWPLFSPLAFDLTVTSIFVPLISGGRIVIYGEDPTMPGMAIVKIVEDRSVDIVKLTPSHLAMIKNMDLGATRIRKLIVGGEDFKTGLALDITKKFGRPVEIFNEYGPTEATVGCMIHRYDAAKDLGLSVPIGVPAANAYVFILDEHLCPVRTGVTGEMYLAGDGLARGYLNRPELTKQKFLIVEDPRQGDRIEQLTPLKAEFLDLYKTGDLARWGADGRIEFLGRADYQVKIGGIRIELGEIEACLNAHPAVADCVVDVYNSGATQVGNTASLSDEAVIARLVAYYVSNQPLTVAEVRAHLSKELPDYMVPSFVMRLENLPLTSNAKIDRKALPIPTNECMESANGFVGPKSETEKALALIWIDLLKVDRIGVHDEFFDMGTSSLLGVWALSRIQEEFAVDIPFHTLFENPTIFSLANALDAMKNSGS